MSTNPNGTEGTGVALPQYTAKDFTTDQDVRWCPGCGDYAVLTGVRKALPKLGHKKEDYVFVSGIGCAARFPYYMDTFGMHTIHGRSLSVATGIKLANPDLKVCVVSGDGDLFSIGGNHTVHTMRRNLDIAILLLNNRIYGLTKGQYSPTSESGKITESTPMGSPDHPVNPIAIAVASGCTFIARTLDVDLKLFDAVYLRAMGHKGTSFVEIYQDCNIFNHKAFFYATQKDTRPNNTVMLTHGQPLIFGKGSGKGIVLEGTKLRVVTIGDGYEKSDLLVHDETDQNLAYLLSQMRHPQFPEPLGVIYADPTQPTYDDIVHGQVAEAKASQAGKGAKELIYSGELWDVTE
ncbi:MAG: 2-oxoacid:ferredoxin oxidoreductase subunit beta [Phycisphaera sp.]|nr:MAG: 2-oxoacid:ferredoxin oxidoreductase subunit beta [Phycisphaera sp.]